MFKVTSESYSSNQTILFPVLIHFVSNWLPLVPTLFFLCSFVSLFLLFSFTSFNSLFHQIRYSFLFWLIFCFSSFPFLFLPTASFFIHFFPSFFSSFINSPFHVSLFILSASFFPFVSSDLSSFHFPFLEIELYLFLSSSNLYMSMFPL